MTMFARLAPLLVLVAVLVGCTSSTDGRSEALWADQAVPPVSPLADPTVPVEIDWRPFDPDDEPSRCVAARTGIHTAPEVEPNRPVHGYYMVGMACMGAEELPQPVLKSVRTNSVLNAVSSCLVAEHSWTWGDSVLDGVGGAVRPSDSSDPDARAALDECGFNDAARFDEALWPPRWLLPQ